MQILDWQSLDSVQRHTALARPAAGLKSQTLAQAQSIIDAVRSQGDVALKRYTHELDGVELARFEVTRAEIQAALGQLESAQIAALERAITNVESFHRAALPAPIALEVQPGVRCERLLRPMNPVGLYVPAGSAPLPSTVIMLAVPAGIAGCPQRVLCTPPQRNGLASAAVLVAAQLCGVEQVFKIGGAQAIAALAYGTQTVPKVAKIFGPGNAWVTAAKQLVAADPAGAALDMPAGPSEVLVIADDSARAEFVAADLLAQAEHDALAQALLVTTSRTLAQQVVAAVERQMQALSRLEILRQSIAAARLLVVPDLETAVAVSDAYAPEHLIIQTRAPRALLEAVHHAGSVFLGSWSPEPMGDYCSGTNHVLPTYGYARAYSGLSVLDFTRRMTVQELSTQGLRDLGPTAATLARLEGLDAHAAAVELRLESLRRERAA
ncbi:MAG TPA: histidinol dehydrogenase [Steroidobacteraceae bacterium]|nr:histidinol dehydrogenase [Steroidobacteraceae bacterium]